MEPKSSLLCSQKPVQIPHATLVVHLQEWREISSVCRFRHVAMVTYDSTAGPSPSGKFDEIGNQPGMPPLRTHTDRLAKKKKMFIYKEMKI
jgi:hypothetical protein